MSKHRTRRKQYRPWGRQATLEMVVSAVVLILLIATILVFVFVFHDFPMRIS
jgi:heme/copper-type cytochrome/quinol oxidase subunit 2